MFSAGFPGKMKNAEVADLGLYIDSLYHLNLSKLNFKARGWLWCNGTEPSPIEGRVDLGQMGSFDLNFLDEIVVIKEISSQQL